MPVVLIEGKLVILLLQRLSRQSRGCWGFLRREPEIFSVPKTGCKVLKTWFKLCQQWSMSCSWTPQAEIRAYIFHSQWFFCILQTGSLIWLPQIWCGCFVPFWVFFGKSPPGVPHHHFPPVTMPFVDEKFFVAVGTGGGGGKLVTNEIELTNNRGSSHCLIKTKTSRLGMTLDKFTWFFQPNESVYQHHFGVETRDPIFACSHL